MSEALSFNAEFQSTLSRISDRAVIREFQNFERLGNLATDFRAVAIQYGKVIISEKFLPREEKTIKPSRRLGGIAGGEKFLIGEVLFKFSIDSKGLYGSDEMASKEAAHLLKSAVALQRLRIAGLALPLVMLITYRGFRLLAMSLLPIGPTTIRYGSSNGGRTIHTTERCAALMDEAAASLNLAKHETLDDSVCMSGPTDIELHESDDGRVYAIDFSRLFPPEPPLVSRTRFFPCKAPHLCRLLRPELVQNHSVPLSSDAFSKFGARNAAKYNPPVQDAFAHLIQNVIPEFANWLDAHFDSDPPAFRGPPAPESPTKAPLPAPPKGGAGTCKLCEVKPVEEVTLFTAGGSAVRTATLLCGACASQSTRRGGLPDDGEVVPPVLPVVSDDLSFSELRGVLGESARGGGPSLIRSMHVKGINVRYLGLLYAQVTAQEAKTLLEREILARCLKSRFLYAVRLHMKQSRVAASHPYRCELMKMLNSAFGSSPETRAVWLNELLVDCAIRYPSSLSEECLTSAELELAVEEETGEYGELDVYTEDGYYSVFTPHGEKEESATATSALRYMYPTDHPILTLEFDKVDRLMLFRRVQTLCGLILCSFTEAELRRKGNEFFQTPHPFEEIDFEQEIPRVKEMSILSYAKGTALFLKSRSRRGAAAKRVVQLARQCFDQALSLCPTDSMTLCNYAFMIEDKLKDPHTALELYQRALKSNPKALRAAYYIALLMSYTFHRADEAEKYYLLALSIDPNHPNTHSDFAAFLEYNRHDNDRAEKHYQLCLQYDPFHVKARLRYARFLSVCRSDDVGAEKMFVDCIKRCDTSDVHCGNPRPWVDYAKWLYRRGRMQSAVTHKGGLLSLKGILERAAFLVEGMGVTDCANVETILFLRETCKKLLHRVESGQPATPFVKMAKPAFSTGVKRAKTGVISAAKKIFRKSGKKETMLYFRQELLEHPDNAALLGKVAQFMRCTMEEPHVAEKLFHRAFLLQPMDQACVRQYVRFLRLQLHKTKKADMVTARHLEAIKEQAQASPPPPPKLQGAAECIMEAFQSSV